LSDAVDRVVDAKAQVHFNLSLMFFPNAATEMSDRVISEPIVSPETVWIGESCINFE